MARSREWPATRISPGIRSYSRGFINEICLLILMRNTDITSWRCWLSSSGVIVAGPFYRQVATNAMNTLDACLMNRAV